MRRAVSVAVVGLLSVLVLSGCGYVHFGKADPSPVPSAAAHPSAHSKALYKMNDEGMYVFPEAASMYSVADVDTKLAGLPEDFLRFMRTYVAEVTKGSPGEGQPCAPHVDVSLFDPEGYASGGVADCDGGDEIYARTNGRWTVIWGGQTAPDCATMHKYKVPKLIVADSIGGTCTDADHNSVPSYEPSSGPQRTCLDGAQIASGGTCDLRSTAVMFAVAGVTPDQCTKDADPPWNAPGQSFTCTLDTGEMQVGRFLNASTKAERVATYRAYHYCAPYDGTWYVCGGSGAHQGWLRAYLGDDLLMYMSAKDKGVLLSLNGVPARDVVRHGR